MSVFASAGMATAKFIVGIIIGSLALVSEALHSSVDVVATIITWMVVRISDRPADEEHHYGHGKLESISALGVTFRTRTIEEIREIFDEVRKDIWSAVESRKLQLPIDKVYKFEDIGKAFEHMEANKHLGKIVVTL